MSKKSISYSKNDQKLIELAAKQLADKNCIAFNKTVFA